MAKKNENTQKKISKLEAAPKSIQNLYFAMNGLFDELFDGLNSIIGPEDANNKEKALIDLLTRVLDDYNELEAKHQKECGMISEYEEEISQYKEENEQLKADLEKQVAITEEISEIRDKYLTCCVDAEYRLDQLLILLAAVDVTVEHEDNDNDGVGNWRVCNTLKMKNLELEVERYRYEHRLNSILEEIETALDIQRIHLSSSYDDRADHIIKKIGERVKEEPNKPESLESLKKFLMDEYKFDVTFIRTSPDEGFWKLIQRGPNVFNRKSNNFRWAFRGAMECLGMSPGAIAAEIIWTSNSKVTPTDISLKWSQRACEYYEKGEEK